MASNNALKYNVDIVFCIDATGSMGGILDKVKSRVLNFHGDLLETMEKKNKHVDTLRVRVVAFRDYAADGDQAMLVTDFFNLPEQSEIFANCIRSIQPKGGGDDPEDSLEALAYATGSDWLRTQSLMKRQVIVLWTDAGPHPLGFGSNAGNYPKGMPRDLTELGCAYALRVAVPELPRAFAVIRREHLDPVQIFLYQNGAYREVRT